MIRTSDARLFALNEICILKMMRFWCIRLTTRLTIRVGNRDRLQPRNFHYHTNPVYIIFIIYYNCIISKYLMKIFLIIISEEC
jgi:hypothetical protein